ncbi:MAG: hypothetical protein Fur0014_06570 [Rubrivivax sp.]
MLPLLLIAGAGPGDTYTVLDANGIRTKALDPTRSHFVESLGQGANRYEFGTGSALRAKLGFDSDQTAALSNLTVAAGTAAADLVNADGAVAYQWTQSLAPGQGMDLRSSFAVNLPVPEPGTPLLLAGGLLTLAAWRRRSAR